MHPILLSIGAFEIRTYGVVVLVSFLFALWVSAQEAKRKALDPRLVWDFAIYALIGGIVGARMYYILFSGHGGLLEDPWEFFAVWRGGIGIIGALLGGTVAAVWYCRSRRISFLAFADVLAPGMALGQTVGQLACLANGDSYGRPTDLTWAIVYTDPRSLAPLNVPLHPIELYEMAAYFGLFVLLWFARNRLRTRGSLFLLYLGGYGITRFVMDFFRGSPAIVPGGFPAAQVFGSLLLAISIAGLFVVRGRRTNERGQRNLG